MQYALLFLPVASGYALLVTLAALCVEEFSFHRYRRWRDLLVAVLAAVAENIGYRQLTAWWRMGGAIEAMRKAQHDWGDMQRKGFGAKP